MLRSTLSATVMAALLLGPLQANAEDAAAPADKPAGNSISLQVTGCGDKCAEFQITIYDNGRVLFTPNNSRNSTKSPLSKTGMQNIYTRVSKYLLDTGALTEPAECADRQADRPVAIVKSSANSQKATWSAGCSNQLEKARSLVKVFVNQTGFWRNINSDSRYWEKYWETWEDRK
jgi:hypothetical protein